MIGVEIDLFGMKVTARLIIHRIDFYRPVNTVVLITLHKDLGIAIYSSNDRKKKLLFSKKVGGLSPPQPPRLRRACVNCVFVLSRVWSSLTRRIECVNANRN
jgi:hypothetical protein